MFVCLVGRGSACCDSHARSVQHFGGGLLIRFNLQPTGHFGSKVLLLEWPVDLTVSLLKSPTHPHLVKGIARAELWTGEAVTSGDVS